MGTPELRAWEVLAGGGGMVICRAFERPAGWTRWRVLREGRDGVAVVDREYLRSADMVKEYAPEIFADPEIAAVFRGALEVVPGLRTLWRGVLARFVSERPAVAGGARLS